MGELDQRIVASAEPRRVRLVLDRVVSEHGTAPDDETIDAVIAVAGASDSLGDLVAEDPAAVAVLADLEAPVPLDDADPATLQRSHRRAFLRIAACDLTGRSDLVATTAALSELATALIEASLRIAGADRLAVVGMGKYGAHELNFVSDVDLLLVSDDDPDEAARAARRFLEVAGRCVRIDTSLRPEGRDGPLVRTLESYRSHWERWAAPWEFQALLKAAAVAGPEALCHGFDGAASEALWSRPFERDDLRQIRRMKARAEEDIARRGLADREVKRGRGGIRDIEFSVQLLQLVHGAADPALRVRSTLAALRELVGGGYVDAGEADTLAGAYRLLRTVEHRLQLVNEQQTHTVPTDREQRRRLARTLGYRGEAGGGPTELFDRDLAMHRLAVRRVHEGWYFRPMLEAFARVSQDGDAVSASMTATRLDAFGFRDPVRTAQAVRELATGLTRSSRLMRQLLPLLLDWLSSGPDPDLGLLGLRRLATGEQRTLRLVTAFRDSAETAHRLCDLVSTAPIATEILEANPDLVERLADATRLQTSSRSELLTSAWEAVGWREQDDDRQLSLRRWFRRHLLGIVARDVAGVADTAEVGTDLALLTEATIETALRLVAPTVPFAVVAMGRLGGRQLAYASDVDLVFVHDGDDRQEAERIATSLIRILHGATPASRIVAVDLDLRPEGRQGPLARSLDSYTVYLERWAEVWERQALLRSRPIAGDDAVGRGFSALVQHTSWIGPPSDDDRREIRRLKARVEAERMPRAVDPWRHYKLGPGGLTDVEWTVQLLQWDAGIRSRNTLTALERLADAGVVSAGDAALLADAHRWCDMIRNRTWLCLGQGDALPEAAEPLGVLARSLDTTTTDLVEQHRRIMRRARRVVERRFYGIGHP